MSLHRGEDTIKPRHNQGSTAIEFRVKWLGINDLRQTPSALDAQMANLSIDDRIPDSPDVEMVDVFDIDQLQDVEMTDMSDINQIQVPYSLKIEMTDKCDVYQSHSTSRRSDQTSPPSSTFVPMSWQSIRTMKLTLGATSFQLVWLILMASLISFTCISWFRERRG